MNLAKPELLLPGHVVDEFTDGIEHDIAVAQAFNRLLQEIDPQLKCFWVKEGAKSFANPGRWHIVREHPTNVELNAYWVCTNPDGSYCVPNDTHLEALKRIDTHTGQRTYGDIQQARTSKALAREKAFEEKRREFREKLAERASHLFDARISVPGAKLHLLPPAPVSPKKLEVVSRDVA
jgi:hypothetical protein